MIESSRPKSTSNQLKNIGKKRKRTQTEFLETQPLKKKKTAPKKIMKELCGLCNKPEGDDEAWIECELCCQWFHVACLKFLAGTPEEFVCSTCDTAEWEGIEIESE
jgi:hypothetical protein